VIPAFIRSTASRGDLGYKLLVYGKAGVGKTCLAATAPAPVFLDSDKGTLSIAHLGLPCWAISSFRELNQALDWFEKDQDAKAHFKTIVLDMLSDLAVKELDGLLAMTKDPRQAYGGLTTTVTSTMRRLRDLPVFNVVVLATQAAHEDAVAKVVTYGPGVPGQKLAESLPHMFDCVFQYGLRADGARVLRTQTQFQFTAKCRAPGLAAEEINPNLSEIFARLDAAQAYLAPQPHQQQPTQPTESAQNV
jgi:hypothetical protein